MTPAAWIFAALSLFALSSSLTGCVAPGGSGTAGSCTEPYSQTITPFKIDGGHQLYFNVSDFSFLNDPNILITDVTLNITYQGNKAHRADDDDDQLSMNGFSCSSKEKYRNYDSYDAAHDQSTFHYHLSKVVVNGATSFFNFALQVMAKKGQVKLGIEGKDVHILAASITVSGIEYIACPQPSPTPTQTPVAPKTSITSVSPTDAVTSSTSMTIAFTSDQAGSSFSCSLDGAAASACSSPIVYSGLANGSHSFLVKATGANGLVDPVGAAYSWSVDTVPPSVTIDNASSIPSVTNSTSMSVSFSSDKYGSFQCSLDNGTYAACVSPVSFAGLAEGTHTFSVLAIDLAGVQSLTPASVSWTVDLTPPVTSIQSVSPSASDTNQTSATFTFGANETATFQCAVDGGAYASCASPYTVSGLAEGQHTFSVQGTDIAGNVGAAASYAWTIDLTAPTLALGAVQPANGSLTNATSVHVEFSASEAVSFTCSLDGAAASACTSPFDSAISTEGAHSLVINATDLAGNAAVAPLNVSWTMDFTAPVISFGTMTPSAASYIASQSLSVNVNASENIVLSGTLDGVALVNPASPIQLSGLAEGAHALILTGTDLAGNPANTIEHDFTVDVTAPVVTLAGQYSGITNQTTNSFTFTTNEASADLECNYDSAGFTACASPYNLAGIADGAHVFQVRSVDLAGNVSAVAEIDWTVDTIAPTTSLSATVSGHSVTYTLSSSEPNSTFICSFDGSAFAACTSPVTYSNLAFGNHTFTARATDAAGNTDAVGASNSFSIVGITTSIDSVNPSAVWTNQTSMTINFSASQPGGTFVCSLDGAAASACTSPASYSGLADGSHTFTVQAIDSSGYIDATGASYTWNVDTVAPTITSGPSITAKTRTTVTIVWTTDEVASSRVFVSDASKNTAEDFTWVTSHQVTVGNLAPNTLYSFQVGGQDRAGNTYRSGTVSVRTSQ